MMLRSKMPGSEGEDATESSAAFADLTTGMGKMDAVHGLEKFSSDDKTLSAGKWVEMIEENAEIFGWTAHQKLIIARRTLMGTAALWLKSEKTFKTFEELKAAIIKEFPDQINSKEMHEIMTARKKRRDETCYQYMLIMKELGRRARFPDYVSIEYIIDGIIDCETNKVILYGATTYPVLKEKIEMYEKMKRKNKAYVEVKPKKAAYVKNTDPSRRCYKCGDSDHVASACEKGTKCFRCNEFGHVGNRCTKQQEFVTSSTTKQQSNRNAKGGSTGAGVPARTEKRSFFGRTSDSNSKQVDDPTSTDCEAEMHDGLDSDSGTSTSTSCACEGKGVNNVFSAKINKHSSPTKVVKIDSLNVNALIDSGSDLNLMSADIYRRLLNVQLQNEKVRMSGLGQTTVESVGSVNINIIIDEHCYKDSKFYVVSQGTMPYDLIIGQELLKSVMMIMNEGSVKLIPDSNEWMAKFPMLVGCVNVVLDHVRDSKVKKEVLQYIENYKPVQTKEAPLQLKIVLKDDIPVSQKPRRLSLMEQRIVEEQINKWLEDGIIRVSYSEYSSPVVLVRKKDGSMRVCVDYRMLNRKMLKDEFPLPVMQDLIDKVVNAKVYSVLDLKNGFFHLRVSEESIPCTSFVTHQGQYEFLRAPFGLSICPKYFMRFISIIFRDLIAQGVLVVFIDDILIPAKDEVQAAKRLKMVLEVASQYGLQINWKKANLICTEIEYLGHTISKGEVKPSSEKTDAVLRYPEPKTLKQVHSFVGLTSYFRKYIQDYATIAKPLTDLLRKDVTFVFHDEQRQAFIDLKRKLASPPVLKIFDPKLQTELHTDASAVALSAILMQHHDTGLHPIHFMSRKTNEVQSKYSSYELEALAIVEGVRKFRHYLFGIPFKIVTDCQAFELTLRKKDLTPKVARWVMFLDEYDFRVEHRVGSKMAHADALSRHPYVSVVTSLQDDVKVAQDLDDGLKAIKEILKEKSYQDYWLEGNILYKGEDKKLVIPKVLEKEIIRKIHSNGHFSKKKMKELISRDYYIKDIDKKIEEFIISCIPCLLATRKAGKQEGFLNPIEKESIPLDTLHIDHIGPLTQTKKQYNYILTMVDAFTKFVWLFPTKSTSASETLNKLQCHQQTFGNPRRIISDRGAAYTSHDFEDYCKQENIQHIKITTGVPRGNGQVERIHRIIIPILTKLCIENSAQWFRHVSRVQRCLNSTFQRSINTTPFELLVGTKMRCKEDLDIMNLVQDEVIEQYNENREVHRKQAKEQILKIQEENAKYYNKKRQESSKYTVGDLVAIKRTQYGTGLKLKAKYLGPYKVTKIKRNDRYDLEKADTSVEGPGRTTSSADQMKKWPE